MRFGLHNLFHTRRQLAIGQGFFHTGSIAIEVDGRAFHYLYDCGSENGISLDRQIDGYLERLSGAEIDVLFLSHLHADHMGGLDRLLLMTRAKTAILPYLLPTARLLLVAEAIDHGTLTFSQLHFLADPTGWLIQRGLSQVIYVTPPPPDSGLPNWTLPEPDTPPPQAADDESSTQRRPKSPRPIRLRLDLSSLQRDLSVPPSARRHQQQTIVVNCLQPIRLRAGADGTIPNWQFVTFVHPEPSREEAFRLCVQSMFGKSLVNDGIFEIDNAALLKLLQRPSERDKLAACYSAVRRDLNLTSMSLYSGPISMEEVAINVRRSPFAVTHNAGKAAWIGTGDANLRTERRRRKFINHFNSLNEFTALMSLPHHGSRYNFHPELADWVPTFSVSAGLDNKYGHPHDEVLSWIDSSRLLITTEAPGSMLFERLVVEQY